MDWAVSFLNPPLPSCPPARALPWSRDTLAWWDRLAVPGKGLVLQGQCQPLEARGRAGGDPS